MRLIFDLWKLEERKREILLFVPFRSLHSLLYLLEYSKSEIVLMVI